MYDLPIWEKYQNQIFLSLIDVINVITVLHFLSVSELLKDIIKNCSGKPGIVYNFSIQNIVSFEDNLKYIGDVPLAVYADFETTAPNTDFTSPENNTMFAVSYTLVFAWHPKLNLPRQCVVRGFNHSLDL